MTDYVTDATAIGVTDNSRIAAHVTIGNLETATAVSVSSTASFLEVFGTVIGWVGMSARSGSTITFHATGSVAGVSGTGYDGSGSVLINRGSISGTVTGARAATITNSGDISGNDQGVIGTTLTNVGPIIGGRTGATASFINNSGTISGVAGGIGAGGSTVIDSGTISGDNRGVSATTLTNIGVIFGAQNGAAAGNTLNVGTIYRATSGIELRGDLTNTGTIAGRVGVQVGLSQVFLYVVSDSATFLSEFVDDGYDVVLTSVDFTLAGNVEEIRAADARGTSALRLFGNGGNNRLVGNAGDNLLNGNAGADTMYGGAGNDRYVVDDAGDVVVDASGSDTVESSVDFTLGRGLENMILVAGSIDGTGNAGANTITGSDGDNVLNGRGGVDTLIGGGGADAFVIDVAVRAGNLPTITDFATGTDTIALDDAAFRRIGGPGTLADAFFTTGPATTRDHHILYDQATGVLSYDADGSGTAFAAIAIASVAAGAIVTAADIMVI